jgi:S-adenosyl-L-methionine hydrolase (adenosine-forming)
MARPVIALLTDFGNRDHYVAAMKGVILGLCPDASIVDITHEIPPQDILAGALELEAISGYLPSGSVVVGVVDPGVGSGRRAVAIEAEGLRLIGPDNGLFSLALQRLGAYRAFALEDRRFTRDTVSRTFEGRDRFAPAAAHLASGVQTSEVGPLVHDLVTVNVPELALTARGAEGVVLHVDRFGNLITNIPERALARFGPRVSIHVAGAAIDHVSLTYADAAAGALCAVIGSTMRLEIAVNGGNAAARLAAERGTPVHVLARSAA